VPRIQDENLESQGRGGHGKIGHRDKSRDSHRGGQAIAGDVTKGRQQSLRSLSSLGPFDGGLYGAGEEF